MQPDLDRYQRNLTRAFTAVVGAAGFIVAAPAALDAIGSIASTRNIPHLKEAAAKNWAVEGYKVTGIVAELPTTGGYLSMYDYREGGGLLRVSLQDSDGNELLGESWYDIGGYMNMRAVPANSQETQQQTPGTPRPF